MKAIEDNPNHPANKKRGRQSQVIHAGIMAESIDGKPLVYEEYSDDN
jgi:hypothetical protein